MARPYVLPCVLFLCLHPCEGLSFGAADVEVDVVEVVLVEEVAPGTVVGVGAVGTVVVVVEVVGTDLAEELVLGTVVEEVHPDTVVEAAPETAQVVAGLEIVEAVLETAQVEAGLEIVGVEAVDTVVDSPLGVHVVAHLPTQAHRTKSH